MMRMIPVDEVKSIDVGNKERDICPYGMPHLNDDIPCHTNTCMAWYWTSDDMGCCALVYRPETIII